MARRKPPDSGGGGSEWLNTYADMVTLLLTFFILLYAMSSMDSAKFNMLVKAFASDKDSSSKIVIQGEAEGDTQTGTVPQVADGNSPEEIEDLSDIFDAIQQYIQQNALQDSVQAVQGEGYVLIQFMNDMLFEPNSARLKPADLEILNFVGYGVKSVQAQAELIRIDGHTAAIPEDPNYAVSDRMLSTDRANAVLMHFEDVIGVDPSKLRAEGYGKWQPFAENGTEEGRRKNRRVEIFISGQDLAGEEMQTIYEKLAE